jgi:hypothetical protein
MKLEFSQRIFQNTQISNFMKIRPVGVELFHADERKYIHDEANSRFLQFYETHLITVYSGIVLYCSRSEGDLFTNPL